MFMIKLVQCINSAFEKKVHMQVFPADFPSAKYIIHFYTTKKKNILGKNRSTNKRAYKEGEQK